MCTVYILVFIVQDVFNALHLDVPVQVCFGAIEGIFECACLPFFIFLFFLEH